MSKYLIVLISVFLTACSTVPKEVIVKDTKTVYRPIPEQLLRKEPVPAPVDRTKYMSMDFLQKEVYLTNFALENMQALGNCNTTLQSIIDYNKAQQEFNK
jgi:hypothetical protein